MIGLDLDGTVLTEQKELTVRTKDAISRALAQGVVVLVATGRPWMGVPEEIFRGCIMPLRQTVQGSSIQWKTA